MRICIPIFEVMLDRDKQMEYKRNVIQMYLFHNSCPVLQFCWQKIQHLQHPTCQTYPANHDKHLDQFHMDADSPLRFQWGMYNTHGSQGTCRVRFCSRGCSYNKSPLDIASQYRIWNYRPLHASRDARAFHPKHLDPEQLSVLWSNSSCTFRR